MQGIYMTDEAHISIERLLKISSYQQSAYLRYFGRTDLVTRIKILTDKTEQFHKLRKDNGSVEKSVLEYCALVMTIQKNHDEEQSLRQKSFGGMEIEEIRIVSQKKADQFIRKIKKSDPKREKMLGYWAVIRTLKLEQEFSFRQIALYLKKYHKFAVAHSTIYQMWQELENETKITGKSK